MSIEAIRKVADELKPCPFCGGTPEIVGPLEEHEGGYVVHCKQCLASSRLHFPCGDDPKPHVASAWNKRAATTPQEAVACAIKGCRPDPRCGEEECVNCERKVCTDHVAEYSSEDGDDPICVECKNPIDALMGIIENANAHDARVVEAARGRLRALTNYGQAPANDEAVRLLRESAAIYHHSQRHSDWIKWHKDRDAFLTTHKQEGKDNG